jgi:hypothetical protein
MKILLRSTYIGEVDTGLEKQNMLGSIIGFGESSPRMPVHLGRDSPNPGRNFGRNSGMFLETCANFLFT